MSAPTKRRHLFYYLSLPIVVAIVFFTVIQLAVWQRAEVVADLTDQVAHQDTPRATEALHQLAAMPRPPVDALVCAATSADAEIAREAQLLVSGLLRRCQRKIDSEKGLASVGLQLNELAAALEKYHQEFSPDDDAWLSATAGKILRMANRIPERSSPLVAAHCDAVLASIAQREATIASLVNRDLEGARTPEAVKPAELLESRPANTPVMQRGFSPGSTSPFTSSTDDGHDAKIDTVGPLEPAPRIAPMSQPEAANRPGTPQWQYPGLSGSPAMPIDRATGPYAGSAERMPTARFAADPDNQPIERPLANVESRDLLRRWLEADGSEVSPFEAELTQRGFVRLSERLVAPLFTDNAEDRVRLVDAVLTEPGIDARPWLILLAEDTDADVRLLAVTIMATSDDATLIEKAWQVAIGDHDPRIAGLAGRLRERRGTLQRR